MTIKNQLLLLLFIVSLNFGCEYKLRTKDCLFEIKFNKRMNIFQSYEYYSKSCSLKTITDLKDSNMIICHGKTINYFRNKKLKSIYSYSDGRLFGEQYNYFENGKIKNYIFCQNDSINSTVFEFDTFGNIEIQKGYLFYQNCQIENNTNGVYKIYLTFPNNIKSYELKSYQSQNKSKHKITNIKNDKFGKYIEIAEHELANPHFNIFLNLKHMDSILKDSIKCK